MKRFHTKTLVLMALLAAISIVLTRFLVVYLSSSVRISFGNIPILLASLLLGPVAGGFTGAVADLLGATLFSPFGYYPPLTLPPVLVGVLPALFKPILLNKISFWRIYLIIVLTDLVASIGLTNYLLSHMYGTGYLALLAARGPVAILVSIAEGVTVYILYKRLHHTIL